MPVRAEPDSQVVRLSQPLFYQGSDQRPRIIRVVLMDSRAADNAVHVDYSLSAMPQPNSDLGSTFARAYQLNSSGNDL